MARISKEQRLANLHSEALAQFDDVQTALRDERLQCLQDRRFYSISGAQWEGPLWDIYENKPKFEVNKIALSVMRIISEYRNNRITVDYVSKDGAKDDKLAETCDGLYRADEHDSVADEAYDNAFEEAVGGGFGAWRLRTVYEDDEDEENERQRIQIEPIFDADSSVFFDLNAKRQDKADARFCYVIYSMTRESYKEEWNDDPTDWPKIIHQYEFDWATPDVVYIAEYYKVEDVTETIRVFRAIDGTEERYRAKDFEEDPELENTLAAIGSVEVRQRKIKSRKVHKYIMSGGKVLEDCGYIAGKCIPIIPVYGKRWFVDNVERCMGHVRLAKDAQRLKNMQLSKLGEISALSSVEKPILTPEQVAGHQVMWSEDNLKDYPYLLINPITGPDGSQTVSGPVAYTRAPNVPPAMAALLQVTEQDMQDILGNQQAGEKLVSNISGKGHADVHLHEQLCQGHEALRRGLAVHCQGHLHRGRPQDEGDHRERRNRLCDPDAAHGRPGNWRGQDGQRLGCCQVRRGRGRRPVIQLQTCGHRSCSDRHDADHARPRDPAGSRCHGHDEHGRRRRQRGAKLLPTAPDPHGCCKTDRAGSRSHDG